jgi:hypothetical protein
MSATEFPALVKTYAALIGADSTVAQLLAVAVGCALLRLLPWERGRPVRIGFLLLAPFIAAVSIGVAFFSGVGVFNFIMFGIFEDKIGMPYLTFLPALGIGPTVGMGLGFGVAFILGRILRYV